MGRVDTKHRALCHALFDAIEREVRSGVLVAHRIQGSSLVRETGWVYLKANRVPSKISEMIRVLDELLPRMGLMQTVAT